MDKSFLLIDYIYKFQAIGIPSFANKNEFSLYWSLVMLRHEASQTHRAWEVRYIKQLTQSIIHEIPRRASE